MHRAGAEPAFSTYTGRGKRPAVSMVLSILALVLLLCSLHPIVACPLVSSTSGATILEDAERSISGATDLSVAAPSATEVNLASIQQVEALEAIWTVMAVDQGGLPPCLFISIGIMFVGAALILCWPPELIAAFYGTLILLYPRLQGKGPLDNRRRETIHNYIISHPGISFSELRRTLNLSNGSLVYHLNVLEKNGLIKRRRTANEVEYYGSEVDLQGIAAQQLTDLQLNIITVVSELGEVSKSELRRRLRCSHQTLHYNLMRLESMGLLQKELKWGKWNFSVSSQVDVRTLRGRLRGDSSDRDDSSCRR